MIAKSAQSRAHRLEIAPETGADDIARQIRDCQRLARLMAHRLRFDPAYRDEEARLEAIRRRWYGLDEDYRRPRKSG
jgi:hypothetical protein